MVETPAQLAVMVIPAQTHLLVITLVAQVAAAAHKPFLRPVVAAKAVIPVVVGAAARLRAVRSIPALVVTVVMVTFEW